MMNELLQEILPNQPQKHTLYDPIPMRPATQSNFAASKPKQPDDSFKADQQKLMALLEKSSSKPEKPKQPSKHTSVNPNKIPEFKPKVPIPEKKVINKSEVKPLKIHQNSVNKEQKPQKEKNQDASSKSQIPLKQSLEKHEKIEKHPKPTQNVPIQQSKPQIAKEEQKIIKQKPQNKPEQAKQKVNLADKNLDDEEKHQHITIQKKNAPQTKPEPPKSEKNGEVKKVALQPMQKQQNSSDKHQLTQKEIEEQKLKQLLEGFDKKKQKTKKPSKKDEKDKSTPKNAFEQQKQMKKDKISQLQSAKPLPFSSTFKKKELNPKVKTNIQNDEYDLSDSFINDSDSVGAEIDEDEVARTLRLLQEKKKVGKYNNEDSDIDEAGYEDIIKEEKKSRVIGMIEDLREEKYIKREKKIEEKQRKKLLEIKNKQELQTTN